MDEKTLNFLATVLVGIASGSFAAFITMRIAVARIEEWREMISPRIDRHELRLNLQSDDVNAHDMEIDIVFGKLEMHRPMRPRR